MCSFFLIFLHLEFVLTDRNGEIRQWGVLCLAYPEARKYLIDKFISILKGYDFDGIFLCFRTEAKPPDDVDAIMDVTETGTTLQQNGLKITDVVMESSAHLIANKKSLKDKKKREKIFDIVTLMKGAVQGRKYLHLYMNIRKSNLKKLLLLNNKTKLKN